VAYGPALLGAQPPGVDPLSQRGIANHDLSMACEVRQVQGAAQPVQRVVGVGHRDELCLHDRFTEKALGNLSCNKQFHLTGQQFFRAAGENRLHQLYPGVGVGEGQVLQGVRQVLRGEYLVHSNTDFRLDTLGQAIGDLLQLLCLAQ
jgi:hypothetical protein